MVLSKCVTLHARNKDGPEGRIEAWTDGRRRNDRHGAPPWQRPGPSATPVREVFPRRLEALVMSINEG